MKTNVANKNRETTHEGAPAKRINTELQLRRAVMACLLWEDSFYESGEDIGKRIAKLVEKTDADTVAQIAIEARTEMKLRHVPLLLCRELARHGKLKADTLAEIIQRPDELGEFLSIYWKDGKDQPLASQVKKGLALAFTKFNEYSLAKYNSPTAQVKLRDVLFLCHAKPMDKAQAKLWKKLVDGKLAIPDTWEQELMQGKGEGKKASWERLLKEEKLGALALIRNLRNMEKEGVKEKLIHDALEKVDVTRVLPFRFITAARHAPKFEPELEAAMFKAAEGQRKLKGKTVILVDVSGSMDAIIAGKSEVNRIDAAAGLAILAREMCDHVEVFTFSERVVRIPARRGFALRDAIQGSQAHSGTYLGKAVSTIDEQCEYDRLIVITDEQSHDSVPNAKGDGYMINVASYKNGVGYGAWTHLDGWSEAILGWIREYENWGNEKYSGVRD